MLVPDLVVVRREVVEGWRTPPGVEGGRTGSALSEDQDPLYMVSHTPMISNWVRTERLIQEQQLWPTQQCLGDSSAPRLAIAEIAQGH